MEPDLITLHCIHSVQMLTQEIKFRREMEKLRNGQQRDITLEVERDRASLIQQTMKQLNTQYNRRSSAGGQCYSSKETMKQNAVYNRQ